MPWWAWLILGLLLLVGELLTPGGLYLLFAGVAALAVGLLALAGLDGPAWVQWLLFSVIAVSSLGLLRSRLAERFQRPDTEILDGVVGENVRINATIEPGARGQGEFRGTVWNVRNDGPSPLEPGSVCRIDGVDGVTLSVGQRLEESK